MGYFVFLLGFAMLLFFWLQLAVVPSGTERAGLILPSGSSRRSNPPVDPPPPPVENELTILL